MRSAVEPATVALSTPSLTLTTSHVTVASRIVKACAMALLRMIPVTFAVATELLAQPMGIARMAPWIVMANVTAVLFTMNVVCAVATASLAVSLMLTAPALAAARLRRTAATDTHSLHWHRHTSRHSQTVVTVLPRVCACA